MPAPRSKPATKACLFYKSTETGGKQTKLCLTKERIPRDAHFGRVLVKDIFCYCRLVV